MEYLFFSGLSAGLAVSLGFPLAPIHSPKVPWRL